METFEFWKTMNKQMRFSLISARLALTAIVAVTLTASAQRAFAQGQTQAGGDRIPVTLSDPSRPARVKVSMVKRGVTGEAYEGKKRGVGTHRCQRQKSR